MFYSILTCLNSVDDLTPFINAGILDALIPVMLDPTVKKSPYLTLFTRILQFMNEEATKMMYLKGCAKLMFDVEKKDDSIIFGKFLLRSAPIDVWRDWIAHIFQKGTLCENVYLIVDALTEVPTPNIFAFQAIQESNLFSLLSNEITCNTYEDISDVVGYLFRQEVYTFAVTDEVIQFLKCLFDMWYSIMEESFDDYKYVLSRLSHLFDCIGDVVHNCTAETIHLIDKLHVMKRLPRKENLCDSVIRGLINIVKKLLEYEAGDILERYLDQGLRTIMEEASQPFVYYVDHHPMEVKRTISDDCVKLIKELKKIDY